MAVGIDPQRCAGIAEVTEGARAEIFSGLRGGGWSVPAEGAGGAGRSGLAAGEECDRFGAENRASAVEHDVGETGEIFGGGEEAGVSGNAAEDVCVFVLDFALDEFLAEGAAGCAWLRLFCRQRAGGGVRATLFFRARRRSVEFLRGCPREG